VTRGGSFPARRGKADPPPPTLGHLASAARRLVGATVAAAYPETLWMMDPVAAIVIALLIFLSWTSRAREDTDSLVGRAAPTELLSLVAFISVTHSPLILQLEKLRGYTLGTRCWIEIDIVISPSTPLRLAHDAGESLQRRVESLPEVERCFVHVDVDVEHRDSDEHPCWGGER